MHGTLHTHLQKTLKPWFCRWPALMPYWVRVWGSSFWQKLPCWLFRQRGAYIWGIESLAVSWFKNVAPPSFAWSGINGSECFGLLVGKENSWKAKLTSFIQPTWCKISLRSLYGPGVELQRNRPVKSPRNILVSANLLTPTCLDCCRLGKIEQNKKRKTVQHLIVLFFIFWPLFAIRD